MIQPEEAWEQLEEHLGPLPEEMIARRRALGRVLTRTLPATLDIPAHDVSAMDGFALTGDAPCNVPVQIKGSIAAGDSPGLHLAPGEIVAIMTGALIPGGADRVVPVEQTESGEQGTTFRDPGLPGHHIRRRAEIVAKGDDLVPAGFPVTAGALGLLATHGYEHLPVHRAPTVATLPTGDEVVVPDRQPLPGQLRDSHTDFLLAAGRSMGLDFQSLGIATDSKDDLRNKIRQGLETDVLLLCGGVSKGEHDLVEPVLLELGCVILVESIAMQPGKPMVLAKHPGGLVFGLPGNPGAVMVGFWLFVRPALRRLLGGQDGFWTGALTGTLEAALPGAKARDRFLPARVRFAAGEILVRPQPPVGSHDLAAYACGTALVRVSAGSPSRQTGESCTILPLADWRSER